MKNKGHMRWSRQGANALLQVRCAVLNDIDMLNFMRWYPRDRKQAYPRPHHASDRALAPVSGRSRPNL
jgi:hypothetical protein